MTPLEVKVTNFSTARRSKGNLKHAEQVFAGLDMLHFQKKIKLSYAKEILPNNRNAFVEIETCGKKIAYDMRDQPWLLEEDYWDGMDYGFKRMYSKDTLSKHRAAKKIHPLGFNYPVYSDKNQIFKRALYFKSPGALLLSGLRGNRHLSALFKNTLSHFSWHVSNLEAAPRLSKSPTVLFAFILRDPAHWPHLDPHEVNLENQMRAECFLKLKESFGESVLGGAVGGKFAETHFPKLIWKGSRKADYIKIMKQADIGVSTHGIWGSVPWKFGEYIACSKSIVSESFNCEVPGDFQEGRHYLAFKTPEECVKKVGLLLANEELRFSMEKANHDYYLQYLRPDKLVWNTLEVVMREAR